ncbi:aspartate/glutamate racemase family protein [Anaerophilus nitritogenes]|uniref:aspartate/glutamate racemase family protein n=1 Tax=Anaerophilus nitritogenes TaxID=2498136 RepID=UPI00101B7B2F|nr:aspartate/glutamate racemase family protein [Anaerophilus nitritogenes]
MKVAVIAGTLVDTKMGVDFLKEYGLDAGFFPISKNPKEQSTLQILSQQQLQDIVQNMVRKIKEQGYEKIIIYCNSLSCAIDMNYIQNEENIRMITPLEVYKEIAVKYKNIAVIAANNQSCAGIENSIQKKNIECNIIGLGNLKLVEAIEEKRSPQKLIEDFKLDQLLDYFRSVEAEALILGCTHFSYLKESLEELQKIHIIDPSYRMYEILNQ